MAGGVFYREFTKWNGYIEQTTLLEENALLKKFFVLYNIALPFMSLMMLIRGTVQVLGINLGKMRNGMISGLAGLSHIGIMIALLMLLISIKREMIRNDPKIKKY